MPSLLYRSAYVLPAALALALVPGAAAAGEGEVHAAMQCDRASEPGRVRCAVDVRIEGGRTIAWADVEILALPDFASALKGRIGPQDALSRDATTTKWALGLVARRAGVGEARARVRVVACDPARPGAPPSEPRTKCSPIVVEVKASLQVG
jgi:hypothetical protein